MIVVIPEKVPKKEEKPSGSQETPEKKSLENTLKKSANKTGSKGKGVKEGKNKKTYIHEECNRSFRDGGDSDPMSGTIESMLENRLDTLYYEKEIDTKKRKKCFATSEKKTQTTKTTTTTTTTDQAKSKEQKASKTKEDEAMVKKILKKIKTIETEDSKENRKKIDRNFQKLSDLLDTHIKEISSIQDQISTWVLDEFGKDGVLGIGWLEKLTAITSKMAKRVADSEMPKASGMIEMTFEIWRKYESSIRQFEQKKREKCLGVLARLIFVFLFHGDISKAAQCLHSFISMSPSRILIDTTLAWFIYLDETAFVKEYLTKAPDGYDISVMCQFLNHYIAYWGDATKKDELLRKMSDAKLNTEDKNTNLLLQNAYINWMRSFLANVKLDGELADREFPDRISQLNTCSFWLTDVVMLHIPGLYPRSSENLDVNFFKFFESIKKDTSLFVLVGSCVAWMFEARKSLAFAKLSSAQTDAWQLLAYNWKTSLRMGSPYRVLQSMNALLNYYMTVKTPQSEHYVNILRHSIINFLSPSPLVVQSDLPKSCDVLESGKRRSDRSATFYKEKIAREMDEKISRLLEYRQFHFNTSKCKCFSCLHYDRNCFFAIEFMYAYVSCNTFSKTAMMRFSTESPKIAKKYNDSRHFAAENGTIAFAQLNEIFGQCAVRWMERWVVDCDSDASLISTVHEDLMQSPMHTFNQRLLFEQLLRQLRMPLVGNYSWMTKMDANIWKGKETIAEIRSQVTSAINDYSHVLDREWRFRVFSYLGRLSTTPWESAFGFAESTSIGLRGLKQKAMKMYRRGAVSFSSAKEFQKKIKMMPKKITIVQIAVADNGGVYLVKLHADRDPIVIPLLNRHQVKKWIDEWGVILGELEAKFAEKTMKEYEVVKDLAADRVEVLKEAKQLEFWKHTSIASLNSRVAKFVESVQEEYFDVFAYLLLPSTPVDDAGSQISLAIEKLTSESIKRGEALEFVDLATKMSLADWKRLVLRYCEMCDVDDKQVDVILALYGSCAKETRDRIQMRNDQYEYTYFIICPELSNFCWENLPIFKKCPHVTRMVSIHHMLNELDVFHRENAPITRCVNMRSNQNGYFLIDPGREMGDTYCALKHDVFRPSVSTDEGAYRRLPMEEELVRVLTTKRAFYYVGVGNGSQFIGDALRKSACNAICLLLGSESIKVVPEGVGFDGSSVLNDYAMAGCPTVGGFLWQIFDEDMNIFINQLFKRLFFAYRTKGTCELSDAVNQTRAELHYKCLTGYAFVTYGFPAQWSGQRKRVE